MGLSGRLFGFSSASLLVPEAIMGVVAVWLTFATARRLHSALAGFVAGAALAITPVAAMMFRFDNPDAAMVLLITAAAYCTVRAAERGNRWWLALGGVAFGFAFLAKMLEGVMSLPALVVLYAIAAPITWKRKIIDVALAAVAFLVSAGWYVVLTILWPTSSRPYLAGSSNNSFLNLVFGYNGLSRVEGRGGQGGFGARGMRHRSGMTDGSWGGSTSDTGMNPFAGRARGGGQGAFAAGAMGGKTGPFRLFSGEFGLEISWLLPAALVAFIAIMMLRRRAPRADLTRAGAIAVALWLVVDGGVLSFMGGTTHAYYTLAIAPPIAILVGLGLADAWVARASMLGRVCGAAIACSGALWSVILWQNSDAGWLAPLRWVLALGGLVAVAAFLLPHRSLSKWVAPAALALGLVTSFGAPAAYAINADTVAHTGGSPTINPVASQSRSGMGRGFNAESSTGSRATNGGSKRGHAAAAGRMGDENVKPNPALAGLLRKSTQRWAAATNTTSSASVLELETHTSVMGIGGFLAMTRCPRWRSSKHWSRTTRSGTT